MDLLRTEWRWFSNEMLVADQGNRPVVLGVLNRKLAQRDERGVLVEFNPKSQVGLLVKAAPTMLVALENAKAEMEAMAENKVALRCNAAYNGVVGAILLATTGHI